MEIPPIYRPIPRRAFEITPASSDSSYPPSPAETTNPELLSAQKSTDASPSRTRSILNLTSSTLLGIYSPVSGDGAREEMSTPWGTGAQTPTKRRSVDDYDYKPTPEPLPWNGEATKARPKLKRRGFRGYVVPLMLQTMLLGGFGIGYGSIVTHLHKTQRITPVPVPDIDRSTLSYQLLWGLFGVLLGNALPVVDSLWENFVSSDAKSGATKAGSAKGAGSASSSESGLGPLWYSAVALTLALANPVLWYLIDRSLPGLAFSAAVSTVGTMVLLVVDPNFVPVPAIHQPMASEKFGVYTWLASILFCTSICFGAIGRRLQL
ncbi:INSIG domain protein [Cladophialophora carrionii]|uniref:INSIG domain protein n=1 Tax=Cladophialophora carrionii TaxID=86049 RepID=A0A1C1CBT2_9EURO|nr:INSIG domain protein [Cladophialophora carrionii]